MEIKTYYKCLGCLFCLILFTSFGLNTLSPDQTFSESENRSLTQKPVFSLQRLLGGGYTTKYEKYVNDQFYGRQTWVELKTGVDLLFQKRENNHVYVAADGYFIEDFIPGKEQNQMANLQAINQFVARHPMLNYSFLLVPTAISVLGDKLPYEAPVINQLDYIEAFADQLDEQILFVNPFSALTTHLDEALFYKTDHHWTTRGAYYAYLAWADQVQLDGEENEFQFEIISSAFNGTLSSKGGYTPQVLDQIEIYVPIEPRTQMVVHYVEEQKRVTTLYESEALAQKDKYAVFLGGNHALVDIQTTAATQRNLLLIKDSYANAFVPFLVSSYDKIIMVDPRYYFDDLEELVEREEITDVLFLYNASSFFSDNSLNLVLDNE